MKGRFDTSINDEKKGKEELPPEHSIVLRVVVLLMSLLTIGVSSIFSQITWPLIVLYISAVISGNYFSYIYRENMPRWMKFVSFAGILFVGFMAVQGFLKPLATEFDLVAPFVIFLAGVFSFLAFEMRSRGDLNLASGMGLILICVCAPVAKGLPYGVAVLSYITLGAIMLYFDCVARIANEWLVKPIQSAPEVRFGAQKPRRKKVGSTISAVLVVPVIAMMLFLFMPRPDGLIDQVMSSMKVLNFDYILDSLMPPKAPKKRDKEEKRQSPKEWFMKNSKVIENIEKNKKEKDKKAEKLKKELQKEKDAKGKGKSKKNKKKKEEKLKLEKIKSKNKIDEFKDKNKKTAALEKGVKKENPSKDGSKKEDKDAKSKDKSKSKESKDSKKKDSKSAKKASKDSKGKGKGKADSKKSDGSGSGAGSGKGNSKGKGKGKGEGKGKGKGKGKSKSGGAKGKGAGEGGKSGGGSSFVINDEKQLDLRNTYAQPNFPVLEVQARRLVYLRRKCFDRFDGVIWRASKIGKKVKSVKVVDGKVKRPKIKYVPPNPNKPEIPTQSAIKVPPKGSILAGPGSLSDFKKKEGLSLGAGSSKPVPRKVKVKKVKEERGLDFNGKLSKGRKFEFLSRNAPRFPVGRADAFAIPAKYPSIDLTQEITVKAKSIGKIVPNGWIPKEVSLKQSEISVDPLGVIEATKPIEQDAMIKIKTELPIFNLGYMRNVDPISATKEELIRDNFSKYLQLPKTITDELFELAENNTSPEFNWYVQSEQIAEYLRENYTYSGVDEFSGDSKDLVYDFLFKTKSGENIHFASAFVLLNRCIGIPARLVTGFAPGRLNPVTGVRVVRGNDTHAWAEVFIPDMGWVPFDATPDGYLPAQQRETEYTAKDLTKKLGFEKEERKKQLKQLLDLSGWVAAGALALVALFFIGRFFLKKIIAFVKSRLSRGPEWRCYKKVAKAVKNSTSVVRYPSETPEEFSSRVKESVASAFSEGRKTPSGLPENLDKFLDLYNKVYFGRQKEHLEDLKYYADLVQMNAKQSRSE